MTLAVRSVRVTVVVNSMQVRLAVNSVWVVAMKARLVKVLVATRPRPRSDQAP